MVSVQCLQAQGCIFLRVLDWLPRFISFFFTPQILAYSLCCNRATHFWYTFVSHVRIMFHQRCTIFISDLSCNVLQLHGISPFVKTPVLKSLKEWTWKKLTSKTCCSLFITIRSITVCGDFFDFLMIMSLWPTSTRLSEHRHFYKQYRSVEIHLYNFPSQRFI